MISRISNWSLELDPWSSSWSSLVNRSLVWILKVEFEDFSKVVDLLGDVNGINTSEDKTSELDLRLDIRLNPDIWPGSGIYVWIVPTPTSSITAWGTRAAGFRVVGWGWPVAKDGIVFIRFLYSRIIGFLEGLQKKFLII